MWTSNNQTPFDRFVEKHFTDDNPQFSQSIPDSVLKADVDVPAVFGKHVSESYIECGLIDLATYIAREEGR